MKEYLVKSIDGNYIYFDYKPLEGMSYIEIPEGAEICFENQNSGYSFTTYDWMNDFDSEGFKIKRDVRLSDLYLSRVIWQRDKVEVEDSVNQPSHYTSGGIECLDAMQAMLSKDEFIGFLRGNVFKYNWRYKLKNGIEDLKKAKFYQDKLIEVESK